MRKTLILLALLLLVGGRVSLYGQADNGRWKGHFRNAENEIDLYLDLYEETLEAPGLAFLGKMHGYMAGNIYGTWLLVSFQMKEREATLRFSNDLGADSQTISLTATSDTTFIYNALGGNNIRKVTGRKLTKVPATLIFKRKR